MSTLTARMGAGVFRRTAGASPPDPATTPLPSSGAGKIRFDTSGSAESFEYPSQEAWLGAWGAPSNSLNTFFRLSRTNAGGGRLALNYIPLSAFHATKISTTEADIAIRKATLPFFDWDAYESLATQGLKNARDRSWQVFVWAFRPTDDYAPPEMRAQFEGVTLCLVTVVQPTTFRAALTGDGRSAFPAVLQSGDQILVATWWATTTTNLYDDPGENVYLRQGSTGTSGVDIALSRTSEAELSHTPFHGAEGETSLTSANDARRRARSFYSGKLTTTQLRELRRGYASYIN